MEHAFFQSQKMKQEQILAPQQLQSLEILSLPVTELQHKINEELELNPTLEAISSGSESLAGDPMEPQEITREDAINATDKDESLIGMVQLESSYYGNGSMSSDQADTRQHFFDSLTEEPDLADFLLSQIHVGEMSEEDIEVANAIISSLNERGYLNARVEEVAFNANATVEHVSEVLTHLQNFDPPGIAARDLRECLLIQIAKTHDKKSTLYKLIDKHLEDIQNNKIKIIAKSLKLSPIQVQDLIEELQKLNPAPGLAYSNRQPAFISPDIIFDIKDNNIDVRCARDFLPRVRLSDKFMSMLDDPSTDTETKNYLREKLASSRALLASLDMRESTLLRISKLIARDQEDFFLDINAYLKPVTMRSISAELELHETTISRAISGKYLQSPKGLFPMRSFFNLAIHNDEGQDLTASGIQDMIRNIVNDEDPEKPISDAKILIKLKDLGVSLARRTVAKYRENAGIPAASKRKMIF